VKFDPAANRMTQSDPPASLLQFLQQNARRLLPLRVELCCLNRAVRTSASRFLFGTDGRRADLDARDTPRKVGQSRSGRSMALKPLAHPGRPGRGSASAFGQVFDRRDFCVRGIAPVYRHDAWSARHIRWGDLIARAARPMIESAAILKDASDASWRGPAIGSIGRPARAQPAWAAFSGGVDGFILA
jgi:hypothetical protein